VNAVKPLKRIIFFSFNETIKRVACISLNLNILSYILMLLITHTVLLLIR